MPPRDYSEMSVKELEQEAREAGVSGYSSMKKDELIRALEQAKGSGGREGRTSSRSGTATKERGGETARSRSSGGGRSRSGGKDLGVLALLRQEHDEVEQLFKEFEKSQDSALVEQICMELMRHAEMEEQIVYPALREADPEMYYEAHEEHHVAELLVGEVRGKPVDEVIKAKVLVLCESVMHHVEEEENEAFKSLSKLPRERLEEMAEQWQAMKEQWQPQMA